MTRAGPTNTHGRTPSRYRSGRSSTARFMAQYRPKTPATPTRMATPTTTTRLAFSSRRKSNVTHRRKKAATGMATAPARRRSPIHSVRNPRGSATSGVVGSEVTRSPTPAPNGSGPVTAPVRSSSQTTFLLLLWPARFDLLQDLRERVWTSLHVLHHPGPERPRSHLGGHQVGGVEASRPRLDGVGKDRRCVGQDLVGVAVRADVGATGEARRPRFAAHGALDLLAGEPFHEVTNLRGVPERHRQLTREQGSLLVDRREGEPVVIHACLGVLGEEGVDEAGLPVQPAARLGLLEHGCRGIAERHGGGILGPAQHVSLRKHDLAEDLPGSLNRRVVEGDLVADPLV